MKTEKKLGNKSGAKKTKNKIKITPFQGVASTDYVRQNYTTRV
jgi:hypothetical protein